MGFVEVMCSQNSRNRFSRKNTFDEIDTYEFATPAAQSVGTGPWNPVAPETPGDSLFTSQFNFIYTNTFS